MATTTLYLLHFTVPVGDVTRPNMSARHYLGCTDDLERRLRRHRCGHQDAAAIVRAAVAGGADLLVGWSAPGDYAEERRQKVRGHFAERLCAVCRGEA